MSKAFEAGLCLSDLVAVAFEGERLGEVIVPPGKIGFTKVCSIIINGSPFKAGVPLESGFGGTLQIQNHEPLRFVDLIEYSGSSLDPSEAFIRAKMTAVGEAARKSKGRFWQTTAKYRLSAEREQKRLLLSQRRLNWLW